MPVRYLLVLAFTVTAHQLYGQQQDDVLIRDVDNLLLNSAYLQALERIESATAESGSLLLQNKKAEALTRMGRFDEAHDVLQKVQTQLTLQPHPLAQALMETNLGFLEMSQGRSDRAEETLQRALHTFEAAGKKDSPSAAHTLSHLGIVYMTLGNYTQAQDHLHRALSVREATPDIADEWIAASYNDLGLAYSQTDKEKALAYYEQAAAMYASLYDAQHPKIAIAHINTGIIHRDLGLSGEATNNFESALKIWDVVHSGPHPAKGIALYNLGQTSLQREDVQGAMDYYEKALQMYTQSYGPRHPEVALVHNAIGNVHAAASRFGAALQSYQLALQANVPGFSDGAPESNPALKNYYNGTRLLHTLMFKAQAFESRYLRQSLKFSDLSQALDILSTCDSLIDILRHQSGNVQDKVLLGAMAAEVYSDAVRIAYEAGMNAVKKSRYFEKAFYFAEKSKGAVLLESIADTKAKAFAGIPQNLLEEEKEIKSALTLAGQKLSGKPSVEEEARLRETAFNLNRRYAAFIDKLEETYPEYFNLKFNNAIPSIQDVQKLLGAKTALISYTLDDQYDQLYIFLIRKNHFRVWRRPLTKDFDRYLTGLRNSLYFAEINTLRESGYALGRALIPHIPAGIDDLIILPAGRMSLLPFETLLIADPAETTDYGSLPYLITRFSIRYEFSAGLLLQKSRESTTPRDGQSILLCAPVTFPKKPYLGELPGTAKEVTDISGVFTEKNLTVTVYTGKDAREEKIKNERLKDFNFLHFATHGVVDEVNPDRSRIFLQAGDHDEDGDLFAGEIYNLALNADLVTLSACQTGRGKIYKGEGVIGLSRALVYAGAQKIVVSFWNVADESTAVLMKDFYQNLLDNASPEYSKSLRQAKLNLLKSEKYAPPFYWAPFVLIGF